MDKQWELMNQRLVELEEQTRQKVEKLQSELNEKDTIIQQLNAEIEQLKTQTAVGENTTELKTLIEQYQNQIANFDQEKERYLNEITELNQKVNNLQSQLQASVGSSEKLQAMEEQLGVLQEMIKQLEEEKRELAHELETLKEA
ncbi:MAG: hypothetical protein ACTSQ8_18455, partial [Candidatus Helarchaeota archaeon]